MPGEFTAADVTSSIAAALQRLNISEGEDRLALAFRWGGDPLHARLHALATGIRDGLPKTAADAELPLVAVMDGDAGKTLGNILVRELEDRKSTRLNSSH